MCRLPQRLKIFSIFFQKCIESTLKVIKGVVIFQDDVLVYGTTNKQFDKKTLAVKSQPREKKYITNKKYLTQSQTKALVFWETPF